MTRTEFSRQTRRDALARANGHCEASGLLYSLPDDQPCGAVLSHGLEFDHFILASEGGDASLENCRVVCGPCHSVKTRTVDTPKAAKIKRVRDRAQGIKPPTRWRKTYVPTPAKQLREIS